MANPSLSARKEAESALLEAVRRGTPGDVRRRLAGKLNSLYH
jgi:hypothetical protein